MHYTAEQTKDGRWQVVHTRSGMTYGQPVSSPDDAQKLVIEAEAAANIRRLTECRTGSCSI
ncbi:hypothetical protein [Mesorhizobium denitrificans]|jgi:hypothetical protein|uniref:DUF2188 domain-containing protein n=1 Tax=Mesorhizobium denitrificans TaxID=2294114 RepID=A0A371X432_9HYPH|nr:hypothetical protein [Mesorhizobium denitrificans]RFC63986.1 hypothetical protein DY251_19590 [Mesorhizobium denitrificans]